MSAISEIVRIEHETLGEKVYFRLREMLISGKFAPGDTLTLRTLANAIGTSPMPVRDALKQLMVDQAIELTSDRAFRVPLMSVSRFIELRDIRLLVEGMAAYRAASQITASEIEVVAQFSKEFNAECDLEKPDPSKLIVLNKQIHFAVYQAARMSTLLQMIEGLWSQIGPVISYDVRSGSERVAKKAPCEHHENMVAALRNHDPEACRTALCMDISTASEYILSQNKLPA